MRDFLLPGIVLGLLIGPAAWGVQEDPVFSGPQERESLVPSRWGGHDDEAGRLPEPVSQADGEPIVSIVTGGLDRGLMDRDASTGRSFRRLDNHTGAVLGPALRPGQPEGALPMVGSIGADWTLRLQQPSIGQMVRLARLEHVPRALSWSDDGRVVSVACGDGRVRLIDPDTVPLIADLPAMEGRPHCLSPAPDGRLLVGGQHGRVEVLSPEDPTSTED